MNIRYVLLTNGVRAVQLVSARIAVVDEWIICLIIVFIGFSILRLALGDYVCEFAVLT